MSLLAAEPHDRPESRTPSKFERQSYNDRFRIFQSVYPLARQTNFKLESRLRNRQPTIIKYDLRIVYDSLFFLTPRSLAVMQWSTLGVRSPGELRRQVIFIEANAITRLFRRPATCIEL